MRCPFCGHNHDRVLDTREPKEGNLIRRRRECLKCKSRFSTTETISLSYPLIIKKDGRRETFSKEKLLRGLQAACQKRPISLNDLETLVERISAWTIHRNEKEIPSQMIGHKVMFELKKLDDVAYIRFASVYRVFKDVQEFVESLEDQEKYDIYNYPDQMLLESVNEEANKSGPAATVKESDPNASNGPRTRPPDLVSN